MAYLEKKEILGEFENAKEFLEDVGFSCLVMEDNPYSKDPSLLIRMEDAMEEEEYIVCTYVPMPEEQVKFAQMLLLFYVVPIAVEAEQESEVLKAVNAINGLAPVGHFVYGKEQTEEGLVPYVHFRYTMMLDEDGMIEEDTLCETLYILIEQSAIMEAVLINIGEGRSADEVMEAFARAKEGGI